MRFAESGRIAQKAEHGDVAEPGGGDEDGREPDEGELGDEDVGGLVVELAEGRWQGEDGDGHELLLQILPIDLRWGGGSAQR